MNEKNKIDFKEITKNAISYSKQKYEETKKVTNEKTFSKVKKTIITTKNSISNAGEKVSEKIKIVKAEEQMKNILDTLYIKSINGIPKVSLPIDDLVNDYLSKNSNVKKAAKSLINNSVIKCGTSGFLTGLGGLATMVATLPANITSVMYVQLRMCCAVAKMAGYDITSDQVQTLIYACLTGSAVSDILKQTGIQFGNKFGVSMVKKIPGKTLQAINQKVGFRFVTKFGEKGIINLGKVVPVLGGTIGGGIDTASTKIIGNNVYKMFIEGKFPVAEDIKESIIIDVEYEEIDDIDIQTVKKSKQENISE
ncbi:MAG: EcsC family protein [Bacilli bacterium]